jgi:hypothetical protein
LTDGVFDSGFNFGIRQFEDVVGFFFAVLFDAFFFVLTTLFRGLFNPGNFRFDLFQSFAEIIQLTGSAFDSFFPLQDIIFNIQTFFEKVL